MKARDDPSLGCQGFGQEILVWGQHSAWTDQVICGFMSDYLASLYRQCVKVVDCLGSQWDPDTLIRVWLNQQAQVPIGPNGTSFLAPPDTHVHSQLKACILEQKQVVQEEWDRHAQTQGWPADYHWGPCQVLTVMSLACSDFRKRHGLQYPASQRPPAPPPPEGPVFGPDPAPQPGLFVRAIIQNQLFVFRPDHNHQLVLFETLDQGWEHQYPRFPPGRGIAPSVASKRVVDAASWPWGEPPKPDWSKLDNLGNYLHQVYHQELEAMAAEPILDMRFQGLQLTPEQIYMLRPPEERFSELPAVRQSIVARQEQLHSNQRRKLRRANKWATKFKARLHKAQADKMVARLELAGSKDQLRQSIPLKGTTSKRAYVHALRRKRQRRQAGLPELPNGRPRKDSPAQVTFQDLADHGLLNQEVRIISARTHPGRFARTGTVLAAQLRKIADQGPGQVLLQISFSSLSDDSCWFPAEEVQSTAQEVNLVPPGPFRIDYQHFRTPSKVAIKTLLGCGADCQTLEPVQTGRSLEASTLHAGCLELQTRMRLPDWVIISPSASVSLSTHEAAQDFTRGTNKEQFQKLLDEIAASTTVSVPVWASGHYTYLHAEKSSLVPSWQLVYTDSLPGEAVSCYQAATSVAKRLGLLEPAGQLPHSTPGQQRDGWSCGLWVLQEMEARVRARRKEVLGKPPCIQQIQGRLNEFILKLKPPATPDPKAKAKAKAQAKAQPVAHASLEEALQAALGCSKCRTTKLGQKGCQKCMGDWFHQIRKHKAIGKKK
jgi:hypothetical protein